MVKQAKALTRNQKEQIRRKGYNPKDWMFLCDLLDDDGRPTSYYKVVHKQTGKTMTVDRYL